MAVERLIERNPAGVIGGEMVKFRFQLGSLRGELAIASHQASRLPNRARKWAVQHMVEGKWLGYQVIGISQQWESVLDLKPDQEPDLALNPLVAMHIPTTNQPRFLSPRDSTRLGRVGVPQSRKQTAAPAPKRD